MTRAATLGLILIAAIALGLRLPRLEERPLHADESVHAIKFLGLWEGRGYRYDPDEYHGPTLSYATLPFAWLSTVHARAGTRTPDETQLTATAQDRQGAADLSERTLRLVPLAFGLGLILLLPLLRDALGRGGVLGAGLFTALSPAFVFYSRYYIHELLLVFFTLLFVAAAWRYWKSGGIAWAILSGAALGLMHATKETFVFALVALAGAAAATVLWERWVPSPAGPEILHDPEGNSPRRYEDREDPSRTVLRAPCGETRRLPFSGWGDRARLRLGWKPVLAALAAALIVSIVLFTSFFTNWQGPIDSVHTYLPWFGRAGGESPHIHPWGFYLERLLWFHFPKGPVWSEALIVLLAVAGWIAALWGQKPADACVRFLRFAGFYAFGLTAVYSVIPYKTPWCLVGFHHGFILLAGAALPILWDLLRKWRGGRLVVFAVLALAAGQLAVQAWRGAFPYATDRRNPHVYAHTSRDLLRLVATIRDITRYAPQGNAEVIKVIAPGGDYWPLPWYLRQHANVGWYPQMPDDPYATLMVVSSSFEAELDERSEKKWLMIGLFEHRPRVFLELYVAFDCWKTYLERRPKPPDD